MGGSLFLFGRFLWFIVGRMGCFCGFSLLQYGMSLQHVVSPWRDEFDADTSWNAKSIENSLCSEEENLYMFLSKNASLRDSTRRHRDGEEPAGVEKNSNVVTAWNTLKNQFAIELLEDDTPVLTVGKLVWRLSDEERMCLITQIDSLQCFPHDEISEMCSDALKVTMTD